LFYFLAAKVGRESAAVAMALIKESLLFMNDIGLI
jgi:hypothetical protein